MILSGQLYIRSLLIITALNWVINSYAKIDVTLVGPVLYADGLGRLPIALIDMLSTRVEVNFISSRQEVNLQDVPEHIARVIKNRSSEIGKVALFLDVLAHPRADFFLKTPSSPIKIAYSMLESDAIPLYWSTILNTHFDAVVVPDEWLVKVYTNSGVKIPIFVIPCPLYLDRFLNKSLKQKPSTLFTFGTSASAVPGKNQELLIDAFAREFGNNEQVQLKIHSRYGNHTTLKRAIKNSKARNICFISKSLSEKEYVEFMASLDCYVLLSKGEGFSITPREALALGIPTIVSDNTAHRTLCVTGLVKAVPAEQKEPAYYEVFDGICGFKFNSTLTDACRALRDVYQNYTRYLGNAEKGRAFAKTYSLESLRNQYVTLIKPAEIKLGSKNAIEGTCLITQSDKLYEKYKI